jgi:hypothetical protein
VQQTCTQCSASFEITDSDLTFYDAVSPIIAGTKYPLPAPKFCPDCRYQERLTWRNERNLYRNTCAATGKQLVSIFSPDKTWPPVYEQKYWWSDNWDPKSYGREFDFTKPFFEQWAALFRDVPQIAMNNQQSENCEFTNQSQRNKDSYMIFCANDSRDCLHGMWFQKCTNCVDSTYLEDSELCYEIVNGKNCYKCSFSQNLENCSEVLFSRNCIGCRNCFGCINLRNKEYWFLNQPCSKEEYQAKIAALRLDCTSGVRAAREQADTLFKDFPRKYYNGANIEDSDGDYILQAKGSHAVFNCRDIESMQYCQDAWRARNCQDLTETVENDFCYSLEGCAVSVNTLFSKKFIDSSDAIYCSHCNTSRNLFGCVALNHGQYCVLNKQYTKEEYEILVPKIIEHMRSTGEWGQHFPSRYSPFGYNESVAREYFPLTREQAVAQGYNWRDAADEVPQVERIIPAAQLPDCIDDVPDDILNWAVECEASGRPFKIIKQELEFCRLMRIPVPRFHHDERYYRRMALRNPRKLWERTCDKCSKQITSSYQPSRPEKVYCEECYLQAVD